MRKLLLSTIASALAFTGFSQITITSADFGQAGDSIVVGNDLNPPANLSVGGTGNQTWDFSSLSVANINTLKFEDPANTASGSQFPNADIATERQQDTLFYDLTGTEFSIDGFTGDPFNLGTNLVADFSPNIKQVEFPSTLNDDFTAVAFFDTTVSCAALGITQCDSARLKRKVSISSDFDAYGNVETPGGTYNSIRQYMLEENTDTVWAKFPFIGWTMFLDSTSTVHNYRWYANGEDWPVVSAIADAQNGDIVSAEFKIDETLISYVPGIQKPLCTGECNGSATVSGLGGLPPYTYQWPASGGGGTNASANGLCAGNYDVTVYDANGDSTVQTVVLEDPDPLSISASIQMETMGNDGAIDLNVSGGSGTKSYSWTGPNSFTANTEDLDSIAAGMYSVTVSDANGCDTTATFNVDLNGLGTVQSNDFNLYPNPASSAFQIEAAEQILSVKVFDLLGNLVTAKNDIQSTQLIINTTQWQAGMYIVEARTESGFYLKKLTIE